LARGFSPPHFPISPTGLGDGWTFERLTDGETRPEGFRVLAREIPHKGGQTFGFRVGDAGSSFAYLSDHSPLNLGPGPDGQGPLHEAALTLVDGVDVLIHDAQFLAREFPAVAFLGHASIEYACALAEAARARTLVLYHHSPTRTDEEISAIVDRIAPSKTNIVAAEEGMVIEL
jgi:phosphoribosyl 1,2-cyclic phosphodiesterase